jgi:uncharacterized damage-inducible protein DinB
MDILSDLTHEFRRHKEMADKAMSQLDDGQFFHRPGELVNSVALIVKHMAGNLTSRWTDFLTTDGEKPTRDRDGEFRLTDQDTRQRLLAAWEAGWKTLFDTIAGLKESDLAKTVLIRGEPQTAYQALLRAATHAAYHVGQIAYLTRLLRPDATWLTIPPGQSRGVPGGYRQRP